MSSKASTLEIANPRIDASFEAPSEAPSAHALAETESEESAATSDSHKMYQVREKYVIMQLMTQQTSEASGYHFLVWVNVSTINFICH